jgi:hypothetical protein
MRDESRSETKVNALARPYGTRPPVEALGGEPAWAVDAGRRESRLISLAPAVSMARAGQHVGFERHFGDWLISVRAIGALMAALALGS